MNTTGGDMPEPGDDEILPIDIGETDLIDGEHPDGDIEMPAWMELDEPIEDEPAVEVEE